MKTVDLFAGCGGLSLGLENAGFEVVHAYDNWEKSNEIYAQNFNHPISKLDLSDVKKAVKEIKRHKPELIVGGPPCQDFSSAGKRDVTLGRADLTYSFQDIILEIKPRWFVMENVPLIKNSLILKNIINNLKDLYGLNVLTLNAAYFGVPQARKRFFLIGHLNGCHDSLINAFVNKVSEKPMSVRDYLGNSLNIENYYRHPRNYSRRGIFSIDEPSPTIRGVNRPLPPSYKEKGMVPNGVNLDDVRPLSSKERSIIQTFPKNFILEGPKTHIDQMIGNAIPVNLAKVVGDVIKEFDKKSKSDNNIVLKNNADSNYPSIISIP